MILVGSRSLYAAVKEMKKCRMSYWGLVYKIRHWPALGAVFSYTGFSCSCVCNKETHISHWLKMHRGRIMWDANAMVTGGFNFQL